MGLRRAARSPRGWSTPPRRSPSRCSGCSTTCCAPRQDVDVTHYRESALPGAEVGYRRRVPDRIEHRLYRPVLAAVRGWGRAGPRLANGSVHRYLGYGFAVVCGALILLVVTR